MCLPSPPGGAKDCADGDGGDGGGGGGGGEASYYPAGMNVAAAPAFSPQQ